METVFALDIGTRAVIGILMQKKDEEYQIIASARTEHTQRAMYDGQIHDVEEVARAVLQVKDELENKTGKSYKKVSVAAAGRALCTVSGKVMREEALPIKWEKEVILAMEMEAVQLAMKKISTQEKDSSFFYCVGYNTVQYTLEDHPITSLVGQRGKKAEITVIATFLPRTVVDGLAAVLSQAGLELSCLTLEPIAAGHAAIPADMRRMNLALVDIGAGTADIGLTKEGSFFAYGMVPIAGDEVTEAICAYYLLDFQEGERIKRALANNQAIEVVDFFGEKTTIPKEEILEVIKPTLKKLTEKISQEIYLLNNGKPQAIVMVGGGSLTPLMGEVLSETIGLPRNRVGIQIRERLKHIYGDEELLTGSDVITPIGIGMASLDEKGLHYYSVSVNDLDVPLFEMQLATVAEALLAAGIPPRSFLGRPGSALIYEVNGKVRAIKGDLGCPAQIMVNGKPAKLEQSLHPGDLVLFIPGVSGIDAKGRIQDEIAIPPKKKVFYNGEEICSPLIILNGRQAQAEDFLEDGCKVEVKDFQKLSELLMFKDLKITKAKRKTILVNTVKREIESELEVLINGHSVRDDCLLQDGDHIEVAQKTITIGDLKLQAPPMFYLVNGEEFNLPPQELRILHKGKLLKAEEPIEDNMEIKVEGFSRKPILSEILPFLDLPDKAIPGGRLDMRINGKKADFTTELNQGDQITVKWVSFMAT